MFVINHPCIRHKIPQLASSMWSIDGNEFMNHLFKILMSYNILLSQQSTHGMSHEVHLICLYL